MGSFNPRVYDPLDLEILDRVFEAAWACFEAAAPKRDRSNDDEVKHELRKLIFKLAEKSKVDFDDLYDKVTARAPERFTPIVSRKTKSGGGSVVPQGKHGAP
jgi:hypothetical protein